MLDNISNALLHFKRDILPVFVKIMIHQTAKSTMEDKIWYLNNFFTKKCHKKFRVGAKK